MTPSDPDIGEEFGRDFDAGDLEPRPLRWPSRGRVIKVFLVLIAVVALALVPPLINVNHFRKQIAHSISLSLGRPVRVDNVALNLLPMPGFTLSTFVVGEDPAFGSEPVIRAETVHVRLRIGSLWQRRVEFSRISLDDPSINLVHLPDGRWNLESILIQAAHLQVAPTAQKSRADAPRFPYIEATGARLNVKRGLDKLPISLTEAKISLWLAEPEKWHLRLQARPTRTDAAPMDTGLVRIDGTLGRAASIQTVPIDMDAEWTAAPLGAVSWVVMGRDAGMRGQMKLSASLHGQIGASALATRVQLSRMRRADFVPDHLLEVDLSCSAQSLDDFHRLLGIACNGPEGVTAAGEIPDVFHPETATGLLRLNNVSAKTLLDDLRAASPAIPPNLTLDGTLSGDVSRSGTGTVTFVGARLGAVDSTPVLADDVTVNVSEGAASVTDIPLDLGGAKPAALSLSANRGDYQMALTGTVLPSRLDAVSAVLPLFAGVSRTLPEGSDPVAVDLRASGAWGSPVVWTAPPAVAPVKRRGKVRRR